MIKIYNINQAQIWDDIVRGFDHYDVYYLSGYVKAFQTHGDGTPQLLYFEGEGLKAIYVFMKRETAIDGFYDSSTPYGYGGVLFEGDTSPFNLSVFWREYVKKMHEEKIVDNFVRYHPVLNNAMPMKNISTVTDLGKTIAIDLSSPDVIWENITSKNRNMIHKAEKNRIEILHDKSLSLLNEFKNIYNLTMKRDNAENYYYFEEAFYESIHKDMYNHYEVFYALLDSKPIAMSIMIYANQQMHYHLSGTLNEYRCLAPNNLMLYKAALWGNEQGFKTFHLGGGVGNCEDNLYKFKAAFNRHSDCQFSIGKEIFDQSKYDELVKKRKETDSAFNAESSFFPLYRAI